MALKLIKEKEIYKWVSESNPSKEVNETDVATKSNNLIQIEVACLKKSTKIEGIIKIEEYWPSIDNFERSIIQKKEETHKKSAESLIGILLERNKKEDCLFDYLNDKKFTVSSGIYSKYFKT